MSRRWNVAALVGVVAAALVLAGLLVPDSGSNANGSAAAGAGQPTGSAPATERPGTQAPPGAGSTDSTQGAAGSTSGVGAPAPGTASAESPTRSIVQLGDSVASGEGTLYGYKYDPKTRTWTGGNLNAKWPGPYPLCHDSPDAYGTVVSHDFGADLAQFACTGASFDNGISTKRTNPGYFAPVVLRPAEFGNWATKKELNPKYDAAKPDVVLITMGADDVQFVEIVEACIENGYEYAASYGYYPLQCVSANPGPTVTKDFLNYLPTLVQHYQTLAKWIIARGKADGKVPKVVFTNYYDPMPEGLIKCPDSSYLYPQQTEYLSTLLHRLDATIVATIDGLHDPNIAVADISHALDGHEWCTADPWAYGLSIYSGWDWESFASQAPFHPTPRGQRQLACLIEPVVAKVAGWQQPTGSAGGCAGEVSNMGE